MEGNTFTSSNFWKDGQGKTICQDERTFHFYEFTKNERAIDIKITLMATVEDLVLGDTKEGSMGIRMAPEFRLRGKVARGSCLNSDGVVGKAIWGKRASWVSYWAMFDDKDLPFRYLIILPILDIRLGGMPGIMVWLPLIHSVSMILNRSQKELGRWCLN